MCVPAHVESPIPLHCGNPPVPKYNWYSLHVIQLIRDLDNCSSDTNSVPGSGSALQDPDVLYTCVTDQTTSQQLLNEWKHLKGATGYGPWFTAWQAQQVSTDELCKTELVTLLDC